MQSFKIRRYIPMFRKIMMLCCMMLVAGALVQAANATEMHTATSKSPRVEGTIKSIDSAKDTITVMVGSETRVFQLGSHTEYMENGKKVHMADLKEGAKVSINADSKNYARVLEIRQ